MNDLLLTVDQVAEQLKLHPKTVLRHIREGRLPATRIGKSYRVERARMEAFAGMSSGQAAGSELARATCIVDVPRLSAADAERIATFMGAVAMTGDATTPRLELTTAFDPATGTLKIVIVGSPPDTGKLLEMLQMQLDR